MLKIVILIIITASSTLSAACHKGAVISTGESDTGTDSDIDSDTDVDVDTDADSDSDTDTDTDTDVDTDVDSDTDHIECTTPITFTGHTIFSYYELGFSVHSVYAANLDGDSDLDVLVAGGNSIDWRENVEGDWTYHVIDDFFDGAASVYAADLDGDSDLDVLGAASATNSITWWENAEGDGSTWTEHTIDNSFNGAALVHAADLDGDSHLDVLGGASYTDSDSITWWENDEGDGSTWTEHSIDDFFDYAKSIHAADLDGDLDLDVLSATHYAETNEQSIMWWENDEGDGSTWTEHTIDSLFLGAVSVYAADLDGDSDLDAVGAAMNDDSITWWENVEGDGSTWAEHPIDMSFINAWSVHAADFDGDSDLDVIGGALGGGGDENIKWWENAAGDGSTWTEHTIEGTTCIVYTADFDGDSDQDVLSWGSTVSPIQSVGWLENSCVP